MKKNNYFKMNDDINPPRLHRRRTKAHTEEPPKVTFNFKKLKYLLNGLKKKMKK